MLTHTRSNCTEMNKTRRRLTKNPPKKCDSVGRGLEIHSLRWKKVDSLPRGHGKRQATPRNDTQRDRTRPPPSLRVCPVLLASRRKIPTTFLQTTFSSCTNPHTAFLLLLFPCRGPGTRPPSSLRRGEGPVWAGCVGSGRTTAGE